MEEILSISKLTKNQFEIYEWLLRRGPAGLSDITKFTGKYRANTIDALKQLSIKGLVIVNHMGGKRTYQAADPVKLSDRCQENFDKANAFIRQLEEVHKRSEEPKIEVICGRNGLKTILNDEIKTGKMINVMQSAEEVEKKAGSYLEISRNKRIEKRIRMRIIYDKTDKKWAQKTTKYKLTEVRISRDKKFGATIDTYGDKVAIIFGEEPTIIKITDIKVAERFRQLFEKVWRESNQVK